MRIAKKYNCPALCTFFLILCSQLSYAQIEHIIVAGDGATDDFFGNSVSISDTVAVVGAYREDANGFDSGSAYVYRSDGINWLEEQKLTAGDGAMFDYFGISVSVSDTVAIIGANYDDDNGTNSGSVYVFHYNGSNWVEVQKLTPLDGAAGDEFGFSVAVDGNIAVIGAFADDDNGSSSGSAYVFRYNGTNWVEEDKFTAIDGNVDDFFGYSVAISDTAVVVGAYLDDDNGINSGSAYVYRYDGANWTLEQKLTATNGVSGDAFGFSVSLSDTIAVMGAYGKDKNANADGVVYVFTFNGSNWVQQQELDASDGEDDDWFGFSAGVSGYTLIAGAFHDDDNGSESGAAYIFRYDGANWIEEIKLKANDADISDQYGQQVAISGLNAIAGAINNDDNGTNSGSAYIYPLCTYAIAQEICLVTVNSTSTANEVVWNKPVTTFIDSFLIYRSVSGNYIPVGSVSYGMPGAFSDNTLGLNPNDTSYRYIISTKNICSIESSLSDTVKTMHLTAAHGTGSEVILNWDNYIGYPFQYYWIWRDTTGTGNYHLLAGAQLFEFTFTDVTAPPAGPLQYVIEAAEGAVVCFGGVDSSISNAADPFVIGVNELAFNNTQIKVYPNPTTGKFKVEGSKFEVDGVEVYDLFGRLLLRSNKKQIDMSSYPAGIYIVRVEEAVRKLVKK